MLACTPAPDQQAGNTGDVPALSVTGELRSANSLYFGPPAVADVWNYTIAFMAPDGEPIEAGRPLLRFDTQELMTRLRDKNNQLNEKRKELERTADHRRAKRWPSRAWRWNRPRPTSTGPG